VLADFLIVVWWPIVLELTPTFVFDDEGSVVSASIKLLHSVVSTAVLEQGIMPDGLVVSAQDLRIQAAHKLFPCFVELVLAFRLELDRHIWR
jgi:hypothetical protein